MPVLSEISAAYWTMGRHWSGHYKATISVSTLKALFQELYESTLALGLTVVRLNLLVFEYEQGIHMPFHHLELVGFPEDVLNQYIDLPGFIS